MNSLGERIKEIRSDNGLTQKEFANQISVSRPFISRIESDKENPSDSLLKLISATFNVNLPWLKTGIGKKQYVKTKSPYTQVQEDLLNSQMLSTLVNLDERNAFSFCCSVLINILKNSNIKDSSNIYYQEKIKSLFVNIDYYLKNTKLEYDYLTVTEEQEFRKKVEQEFINNIYGNIKDASRAFFETDLNDRSDE